MLFTFLNRRRFVIKTHWYDCAIISVVVGGKFVFTHQRVRRVLGFASGFKLVIQGPKLIWWGHSNRSVIHIKSRALTFSITCLLNHCQCGCNDENCWENLFIDNISLWTSRHVTQIKYIRDNDGFRLRYRRQGVCIDTLFITQS